MALLGVLRSLGWHRSIATRRPVDASSHPIPWWTYPTLYWLEPKVRRTDRVLEWGGGNSTLWFSERVNEVVTIEHSLEWADELSKIAPSNVRVLHRPSSGREHSGWISNGYVNAIRDFPASSFDVIVIDGMDRNACARLAPSWLRNDGLVIYDNSDRPGAQEGLDSLGEAGFYRVDFMGAVAGYYHPSCTSCLFRDPTRWLTGAPPPNLGF